MVVTEQIPERACMAEQKTWKRGWQELRQERQDGSAQAPPGASRNGAPGKENNAVRGVWGLLEEKFLHKVVGGCFRKS